jgi:hypothetical protein
MGMPVNLLPIDDPGDDALRELDEILAVDERFGADNLPRTPSADEMQREYTVASPKLLRRPCLICRDWVERRRRYLRRSGKLAQYEKEFGGRDDKASRR